MNMEPQTIGLLNEVAKNAEMGKHTAQDLAGITEDVRMKNELQRQVETYEDLQNRARAMLAVGGEEPKDESAMAKMSAKMGVKMQTVMDKSNTNLAKMIIEGSHMGEKDLEEAIRRNPGANVGAVALAKRLHHAESEYAQQMKNFL